MNKSKGPGSVGFDPSAETETDINPKDLEFGPGNYEAIRHTCEAIGQVMESWGFKKIMGMMWGFLYLCPEPATSKDICQTLGISPALASITLQELQRWGVVKKLSPLGKRRDYYVAEHDVWKMLRRVLREREAAQMENVRTKLQQAISALDQEVQQKADLTSRRTSQFQKLRVEDLVSVTDVSLGLLYSFLDEGKLNVEPIFSALKPYNLLAKSIKAH